MDHVSWLASDNENFGVGPELVELVGQLLAVVAAGVRTATEAFVRDDINSLSASWWRGDIKLGIGGIKNKAVSADDLVVNKFTGEGFEEAEVGAVEKIFLKPGAAGSVVADVD